jgi:tetratricopeptide (TPR) repeat protein/serine/threonine protein kinase
MSDAKTDAKAIFLEALDCKGGDDRRRFLDQACGTDLALGARVDELLRAHRDAGAFLGGAEQHDVTRDQPGAERPDTMIGPYKLLEQIGEGGFGLVFMAEQQQPVRRKVALKVLKPGMDTRQVIARFEAERQALALMDHPNIARVLDAGETSSGRPHFVMELVKGVPITDYCDQSRLTTRERLALFMDVCHAVQHAHHKGIIHRDLKPSNVMVTLHDSVPVVKVIDFGIAKALGQQLTDKTLFTGFAQMVGTPLYMSPEQAQLSGLDVDTRSDIYSLGVLLYELLAGVTPFDKERMRTAGYDEMRRIIREEDPPRPSTRLSTLGQAAITVSAQRQSDPKRLCRLLRGELDWIVMKALEKDRDRRYETANELAADIERYLHDEAVLACPPSRSYLCRKFIRRHRRVLVTASACTVLLLAVLAVVAGSIGWVARERSARQAAIASKARQSIVVARTLLEQGRLSAARQKLTEARGHLDLDPAAARMLVDELVALESQVGKLESFFHWVDLAHGALTPRSGVELIMGNKSAEASAPPGQPPVSVDTGADAQPNRAEPYLLKALSICEVMERADWTFALHRSGLGAAQTKRLQEEVYEDLVWLVDSVAGGLRDPVSGAKLSPESAGNLALRYLDKAETARPPTPAFFWLRARCRTLLQQKEAAQSDEQRARQTPATLAVDYNLLGLRAFNDKNKQEAIREFESALRIEPTHYWSLVWLGACLLDLGGENDWREAARVYTGCIMQRPHDSLVYTLRGCAYWKLHRYDDALADSSRAIALDPANAEAFTQRGNIYRDLGKQDLALADLEHAVRAEPGHAVAHVNLGTLLWRKGRLEQAVAAYEHAINLNPDLFEAHANLAALFRERGLLERAIPEAQKAVSLRPNDPRLHLVLANAFTANGQTALALAAYETALRLDPKSAITHVSLGVIWCDVRHDYDRAIAQFRAALQLDSNSFDACYNLGKAYRGKGLLNDAIAAYRRAIAIEPDSNAHNSLGVLLRETGRPDEAAAEYEKSLKLKPDDPNPHVNLGSYYCDIRHDYDRASAEFREAIRLRPTMAVAHSNLGIVLANQGLLDPAINAFKDGIRLDPNAAGVRFNLGTALRMCGRVDEAVAAFNEAVRLQPDLPHAHRELGDLLCDTKHDYEGAVAAFRQALRVDPKDALAHRGLAEALSQRRRWEEALAHFKKAVQLKPGLVEAWRGLAWLLATCPDAKVRDPAQAVELASKAVDLAPTSAGVWRTLGVAEYRAGHWKAATIALQKSVELSDGGGSCDWFFLAMAHWQTGDKKLARKWHGRAMQWMEKNKVEDQEVFAFRAEAAQLLGVEGRKK